VHWEYYQNDEKQINEKYSIQKPFVVPTTDGKLIEEHGIAATASLLLIYVPPKWSEPYQTPEFEEYTYIIRGKKQFIIEDETIILEGTVYKNRETRVCNTLTL
jgi:hypothetical protein